MNESKKAVWGQEVNRAMAAAKAAIASSNEKAWKSSVSGMHSRHFQGWLYHAVSQASSLYVIILGNIVDVVGLRFTSTVKLLELRRDTSKRKNKV